MKFLSVRTWDKVRDYIRFHDDMGHLWDERMRRCDTERVGLGDNWEDIYDGWNKEMK